MTSRSAIRIESPSLFGARLFDHRGPCGYVLVEQLGCTVHPVLTAIPANQPVTIVGCISSYAWCDVVWGSYQGWVSAAYVTYLAAGSPIPIAAAQPYVPAVSPWVDARRDARVDYRVERRMDRRWERRTTPPE